MCWDPLPRTVAPLLPWDSATILRWFSSNRKEQPADAAGRLKRLDYFQSANGPLVASTDYTLDARGRRTASAREDGVGWAWGYNDRGEVTSGARGQAAYRYRYDDIGNRVEAAVDGFDEAAQRTSYDANALNQYTAIHHPDPARRRVQGSAHMQAAIEAKASAPGAAPGDAVALPVARGGPQGSAFSATAEAAVGDGAAWRRIEVTATRPAVGVGGGAMRTAREGWQYFPPKEEAPLHDHDGNLTSDARWLYWWDGENRLTAMEEKGGATGPVASAAGSAVPKRQRLEFAYDGESRRVRKRVLEWSAEMNSWVLRRDVRFLYDGWSMIAEFEAKGGAGGPLALSATYAWGLDLSGTETGAGGVGGLLFVSLYSTTTTQTTVNNSQPPPTSVLAPCYDGNGNVLAYADTVSGAVVERYEYDPFGQVMIREEAASVAGRLHHQFSTKYADAETGLVYYGYRYYSPELGRWVSRDPIGERGGVNIYGMLENDTISKFDYLGLKLIKTNDCEILIFIGHSRTMYSRFVFSIAPRSYLSLLTCAPGPMNAPIPSGNQIPDTPDHSGKLYPLDPNDSSPGGAISVAAMKADNGGTIPAPSPTDEHSTRIALDNLLKGVLGLRDDLCCRGCTSVILVIENELPELNAMVPVAGGIRLALACPRTTKP